MPNLTGPIMLQKLNTYLASLEAVREKQLRVLDEIRNQPQQTWNEIDIWNNILALSYIRHRYAILKQALELLSDSRDHVWLACGKKNRKNHYEPIVTEVLKDLDPDEITLSLDSLWSKMIQPDFQKTLNRLKWNIYFAQAQIAISILTAVLICLALSVTGIIFGLLIQSFALYVCSCFLPSAILAMASLALSLSKSSPPFAFKKEISEKFHSLEKAFEMEKNAGDFLEEKLDFTIELTKAQDDVSERHLTVRPPTNFASQSCTELSKMFHSNNILLFSSSTTETTKQETLKEAVERYTIDNYRTK